MTARRKQNLPVQEHSVRFYKVVALTFLFITIILFGVIVFMSSKRAMVTVVTKSEPIDVTTTVGINTKDSNKRIDGLVVATDMSLEQTFNPTGTREEDGVATGLVTIYNETSSDQPLVATTRFLSEEGVLFRLQERVLVPAGGEIEADVYADKEGALGNIGPSSFTIPGLNEAKQKTIYGKSTIPMTGGVKQIGILGDEDVEKAKKELLSVLEAEGRREILENNSNYSGVFSVTGENFELSNEVGEEIPSFILSVEAQVVGILYEEEMMEELAERILMTHAIDDTEIIYPSEESPAVLLNEYDLEDGTARVDVTYTGVATLNPESKQLNKSMFYGKTKDELRRYLLSLDHVYGVEVNLRPIWTQTVPHVADHINLVVKKVE